ncbi:MAG: hypothetical protein K2K03_02220, partial [Prevotella sp.]|nr:hypothetical protein [Prevotella sp.]
TVYREFQPATIHLADGRQLKVSLANIFLKNSSLLYKSGIDTKEANLKTLTKVEFKNRVYYKIDSLLAYQVDTVGHDALFCAQRIDVEAWRQSVVNNSVMTSLDLGDMIGYTQAELANEQDLHFPLMTLYYFRLNGQFVLAHERRVKRVLNKEKRRLMEAVMGEKDFSWTDEQSLLKLLNVIQ